MNSIKFKAWDNDKKQMAKVKAIDWDCNDNIVTCHLEYEDESIEKKYPDKEYGDDIEFLQCTGLKDSSDREIYVGEIIFAKEEWDYPSVVVSVNGVYMMSNNGEALIDTINKYNVRIVGNMYDNPELLK